jgi:capsid assembly protease
MKTAQGTFHEQTWAGTEHSLSIAVEAFERMMSAPLKADAGTQAEEVPYNFSLQDNIGIVSVKGSLVNRDSPWNRYLGLMSYGEIRAAMIHAAQQPEVKAIVLDVASGGGAVSGVADTANLIAKIDKDVKPVYAFSDATMASAAYWLGSSARKVYNSKLAMVGSIGVIATHMEVSKALEEAGVGVTVVRAGKYKALANPYEPLSKQGEKTIQDQLDATYAVFLEHVAESRGVNIDVADERMGQGREFIGQAAVDAGLSDGVTSFDALISKISAKLLDSQSSSQNNSRTLTRGQFPMTTRKALTDQEIAALAAGAPAAAPAATTEQPAPTPENSTPAPAASAPAEASQPEKGNEQPAAEPKQAESEIVAYLRGELKSAQQELVTANVALKQTQDKVTAMETTHSGLLKIAAASVRNMKVALGMTAADYSAMSAEQILAEHAATAEAFQNAFKAGGVAAVNTPEQKQEPKLDPHYQARIAATRIK